MTSWAPAFAGVTAYRGVTRKLMARKADGVARVVGGVMSKADGREANAEDDAGAQEQTNNACLNALRN